MAKTENRIMRRRMAGAWISSVLSISLVLTLVGLTALLVVNARKVGDYFKESMQISVILRPEVSDAKAEAYRAGIDTLYFVKSTTLVSREQGTEELRDMLGEDFLSVFESTPVPVSVDVNLKAEYVVADSLEKVTAMLGDSRLVDEVQCRQSLVEALNTNISRISMVLAALIAVMLFLSFVLIGNTVRLGIYARRFTIHTMRLVGATKGFILRPFAGRAVLQGLVSALLATGVLGGGLWLLYRSFPQLFVLFVRTDLLIAVAGTVVLCG
ncbi:MAG: permease-like cell division protein FtsX, partial [Firmicutes bacterium]|nr:permease-like cell division protein FtsX [Bacillota bacterium]